ncbi:universal stress protein [Sulfitobacter sp. JB4-11]|uniref:universal stress protein n=1 Tax=Sulfitobacter rhodophyticola TaxID=3238304 RepID=UPI0035120C24
MSKTTIVVGLDGSEAGARALEFAKVQARRLDDCAIAICYVIEWSPFSFQTPEENEQRHKRREEEIELARERVLDPALKDAEADDFEVVGIVRHGDAADILDDVARKHDAAQIVVGRVGARGLKERLFGGVTGRLVATASVPVTIIP